ncbi:hypothetical protein AVEN_61551-1 [Araneus ventricosus]|uniref:Uncharacterized protein n=1 Tax=Araneus ventricosus TaxID=182803 RepID=A0A4Y2V381_ARAVE|nr:hypothetical protein AVEN_61551-1 [Araneus ventricosus]
MHLPGSGPDKWQACTLENHIFLWADYIMRARLPYLALELRVLAYLKGFVAFWAEMINPSALSEGVNKSPSPISKSPTVVAFDVWT